VVWFRRQPVPLVGLTQALGMAEPAFTVSGSHFCAAIVRAGGRHIALGVDALVDEQEAMIQELTGPAAAVRQFVGTVAAEDGTISLVLNPAELVGCLAGRRALPTVAAPAARDEARPRRVLVVDDSFTTRTLEKSILEAHGYEV